MLGRTLEQENIDWLKKLSDDGHLIGNHTYDHVNIRATRPEDIQFRFQRSPWLIAGREPANVIRENIRITTEAMNSRLGIPPSGFRTPGGFPNGLSDREDLQKMLLDLGFTWVSSKYPGHKTGMAGEEPTQAVIESIAAATGEAQPFKYPSDLVEVPMSPISDIGAFRTGRWRLEWFLRAIRGGVERVIDRRGVFDFLGHPSCLYATARQSKPTDKLCNLPEQAGPRAQLPEIVALSRRVA